VIPRPQPYFSVHTEPVSRSVRIRGTQGKESLEAVTIREQRTVTADSVIHGLSDGKDVRE
jgi:hypothetical protein